MAQAGAGHHRQRHHARSTCGPGVNARASRDNANGPGRVQQEAERYKEVSHVQDKEQRLTAGTIARPTPKPHQMDDTGRGERHARRAASGERG